MCVCVCMYVYIYMYVCMYVCIYVCIMYFCLYVYIYVCMYVFFYNDKHASLLGVILHADITDNFVCRKCQGLYFVSVRHVLYI